MKVLLLGLGRANFAVADYLIERGDEVFLYEEHMDKISQAARVLIKKGNIKNHSGHDYDLVVTSPGFSEDAAIVTELRAKKINIIDEIEFTYLQLERPRIIAVTGTNGKSTTVSLINSILNAAGINNFLGGNIAPGRPFSSVLFMDRFEYYVLEVSSFQLMRTEKFHPFIAVLTNISRDHLDWHRDFDEYWYAKKRIFANQTKEDFSILNHDDKNVRGLADEVCSKYIFYGSRACDGVWFNKNFHYHNEMLFSTHMLSLPGFHNRLNASAAVAVAKIINIPNQTITAGLAKNKPLPHRLEPVGRKNGVQYINNSMCTNESAAIASFQALEGPKIVILGGKEKGDKADNYLRMLIDQAKACVILGENAPYISAFFNQHAYHDYIIAHSMDEAVKKACDLAQPGDTVILNPGFASFDYFSDFVERGEAYKRAVQSY